MSAKWGRIHSRSYNQTQQLADLAELENQANQYIEFVWVEPVYLLRVE